MTLHHYEFGLSGIVEYELDAQGRLLSVDGETVAQEHRDQQRQRSGNELDHSDTAAQPSLLHEPLSPLYPESALAGGTAPLTSGSSLTEREGAAPPPHGVPVPRCTIPVGSCPQCYNRSDRLARSGRCPWCGYCEGCCE